MRRFEWKSEPPAECPFPQSESLSRIIFTGQSSDYYVADTWYLLGPMTETFIRVIRMVWWTPYFPARMRLRSPPFPQQRIIPRPRQGTGF